MKLCVHNIEDKIKESNYLISYYAESFNHSLEIYKQIEESVYGCVHKLGNHESDSLVELTKNLNIIVEKENLKLSWRWFAVTVLESPRITRELHFKLLKYLINKGITKDYSDFKETSSTIIILILMSIENELRGSIKSVIEDCLALYEFKPNIIDVLAINLFLSKNIQNIENKVNEIKCADKFKDLIEFALWLNPLLNDSNNTFSQKDNEFMEKFYKCFAFRGLRRHFSRTRGQSKGQEFIKSILKNENIDEILNIEPWLIPVKQENTTTYYESQLVLLIEWYLSLIRCTESEYKKNKSKINNDNPLNDLANKSIKDLKSKVLKYLNETEDLDYLYDWLESVDFCFPQKRELTLNY